MTGLPLPTDRRINVQYEFDGIADPRGGNRTRPGPTRADFLSESRGDRLDRSRHQAATGVVVHTDSGHWFAVSGVDGKCDGQSRWRVDKFIKVDGGFVISAAKDNLIDSVIFQSRDGLHNRARVNSHGKDNVGRGDGAVYLVPCLRCKITTAVQKGFRSPGAQAELSRPTVAVIINVVFKGDPGT